MLVVLGKMIGDARGAGVDLGPAELFGGYLFAGRGLYEGWSAQKDRTLLLDYDHLVAHRRHVRPARSTAPHDGGHLRNALRAHARLVVEDTPEVLPVREDLVLQRQKGPAGVDEVDAGKMVSLGYLLGPEVLFDRHRVVGAALDRRVVRHDHDLPPRDAPDAGDHARRRNLPVVHLEGSQRRELQERRVRVEEEIYAVPHRQLAARPRAASRRPSRRRHAGPPPSGAPRRSRSSSKSSS